MRHSVFAGVLVLASFGVSAAGQAASGVLDDAALKEAVGGNVVKIDTPLGFPITVNYGANGIMTGTAGTVLAAYLGSARDRGRWSVRRGMLCQKWFKWLASEESCMTLRKSGDKIHWTSDKGRTGTAVIEAGAPVLSGATASGLGLPLPKVDKPDVPAKRPVVHVTPTPTPAPAPEAIERPEPVAWTAAVVRSGEPRLIAPPTEVSRSSVRAPLQMAAFSVPNHAAPMTGADVSEPIAPQEMIADPLTLMRSAGEWAAQSAIKHRWCHANAFGTEPDGGAGVTSGSTHFNRPSLLSIVSERASPVELPIYAASCLTSEPALSMVSKETLGGLDAAFADDAAARVLTGATVPSAQADVLAESRR